MKELDSAHGKLLCHQIWFASVRNRTDLSVESVRA